MPKRIIEPQEGDLISVVNSQLFYPVDHKNRPLVKEEPEDGIIKVVKNAPNLFIPTLSKKETKIYKNICWSCGHEVLSDEAINCPVCNWVLCPQCNSCKQAKCNEDGIYIFDLESWHDYNNCAEPQGDNNYWVKLDNHELVYKGEILDIDFEIYGVLRDADTFVDVPFQKGIDYFGFLVKRKMH